MPKPFIDLDDTYIVFSQSAGQEIRYHLRLPKKEWSDIRNFMLPAIAQGVLIPGTTQQHFLLLVPVRNKSVNRDIILFCALGDGAPNPETKQTLNVYSAIDSSDAINILKNRVALFTVRKKHYLRDHEGEGVEGIQARNRLDGDLVIYEGIEYDTSVMQRSQVVELIDAILHDINQVKNAQNADLASGNHDAQSVAKLRAERVAKGEMVQALQKIASTKQRSQKTFGSYFIDAAKGILAADVFAVIMSKAEMLKQEDACA